MFDIGLNCLRRFIRYFAASYLLVLLVLTLCFAITNLTNTTLLDYFSAFFTRIVRSSQDSAEILTNLKFSGLSKLVIVPIKDAAFFFSLLILLAVSAKPICDLLPDLRKDSQWFNIFCGLLIASVFIFSIMLQTHGLVYAKLALDPFAQEPSFWYRRILMPALANFVHLTGILYVVFFWMVAAFVFALVNIYLQSKNVRLSPLELGSLYTVAVFASALGHPGYPELLVLGFTILALLDFERTGRSGRFQVICFGLALLTHESAAALAFGIVGLFYFGLRFLLAAGLLFVIYVFTWILNFGFDVGAAAKVQMLVGGRTGPEWFHASLIYALISPFVAFKLFIIVAFAAIGLSLRRSAYREALVVSSALLGSFVLTYLATDYSRIMSFATIGILVAITVIFPVLSMAQRRVFAVLNLIVPSFAVAGNVGIAYFGGLYGLVLKRLF
jgi:hypothetical protein